MIVCVFAVLQAGGVVGVGGAPPLVVNSRTKTALANMLSSRLQGSQGPMAPDTPEPSAAGTLRYVLITHKVKYLECMCNLLRILKKTIVANLHTTFRLRP